MRAISPFSREAGTSTFWCRACSALRTLVNISATGSVNLIVCFSSRHPFAPHPAENLQRLACLYLLTTVILTTVILSETPFVSPCHPERDAFCLAKDLPRHEPGSSLTRTTSKLPESPPAVPAAGSTYGTSQTCADTRAAVRSACSDCACAWKTSASLRSLDVESAQCRP